MTVVVVGVDHSQGADAALRFAADEARLRHATLRVVHAWHLELSVPGIEVAYEPWSTELEAHRRAAEAELERAVEEGTAGADELEIERRVVEGPPAQVLIDESRDADLLVVGSRGRGGFADLLLGSVGQQVAHHAACPVVIVRPGWERR